METEFGGAGGTAVTRTHRWRGVPFNVSCTRPLRCFLRGLIRPATSWFILSNPRVGAYPRLQSRREGPTAALPGWRANSFTLFVCRIASVGGRRLVLLFQNTGRLGPFDVVVLVSAVTEPVYSARATILNGAMFDRLLRARMVAMVKWQTPNATV